MPGTYGRTYIPAVATNGTAVASTTPSLVSLTDSRLYTMVMSTLEPSSFYPLHLSPPPLRHYHHHHHRHHHHHHYPNNIPNYTVFFIYGFQSMISTITIIFHSYHHHKIFNLHSLISTILLLLRLPIIVIIIIIINFTTDTHFHLRPNLNMQYRFHL